MINVISLHNREGLLSAEISRETLFVKDVVHQLNHLTELEEPRMVHIIGLEAGLSELKI